VRVLISTLADSPSVVGWLHPAILLPTTSLVNLTTDQLEAVLAHELAHIRRHDYLVNVLQTLAETLFFYQPAVWWASCRIRVERELCCDDLVVEVCGDPVTYARALTKLERLRITKPELAMSSTAGPLLYRIRRLTGAVEEQPSSRFPAIVALSCALACCTIGVHWPQVQAQSGGEALVSRESIWLDTVKHGDFPVFVHALGKITAASTVELEVAASQIASIELGQAASIEIRRGLTASGRVARIDPPNVWIELKSPVPEFAGQQIDGTIQIKTVNDVTYMGRPVLIQPDAEGRLFKVDPDGQHATRVKVRFGAASVQAVQVLEGLNSGDRVILSDMSKYDGYDRVRLQ
jgi:hypothetical protein